MGCCDGKQRLAMPSLPRQLADLARSAAAAFGHFSKTGEIAATEEVRGARLKICERCTFLSNKRCSKCGCFVHIKVVSASSKCSDSPPKW